MDVYESLNEYYGAHDESARLATRHGQVEFSTAVAYIEKYLAPGMRILEIGAGTGRYAHYFARKGYHVDAVELLQSNIDRFSGETAPGEDVRVTQGNAVDLSEYPSDRYDITLLLGPMYHLFTQEDQLSALSEAIRVTKGGGVLFVAYCMADAAILRHGFVRGEVHALIERGLLDPVTFYATSTPAEVFELYRKEKIDALTAHFDSVERLHYLASDGYANHMRQTVDEMDGETFALYLDYHLTVCERPDMTGLTHHSLDILKKKSQGGCGVLAIRPAEATDAERLAEIQKEAFRPLYERYRDEGSPYLRGAEDILTRLHAPEYRYWCIERDGETVGGVFYQKIGEGTYYLQRIYIAPAQQSRGTASSAILLCERELADAKRFFVDFPIDRPMNRRCYEKAGYSDTGKRAAVNEKLTLVLYTKGAPAEAAEPGK